MAVEILEVDPVKDRERWLALRQSDVTASALGALFGIHPHKKKYELWLEKSGQLPEDDRIGLNDAVIRGRIMEKAVVELIQVERPDWKVWQPNLYYRDPKARMGATPDLFAIDPKRKGFGNIQIKTTMAQIYRSEWLDEERTPQPPLWIALQSIQEAVLAKASWNAVAVLAMDGRMRPELIEVPIHKPLFAKAKKEVADFWASIKSGACPDPDYSSDAETIRRLYTADNGREIDLSGDNLLPALIEERAEILALGRAQKARLSEIDAEIVHKLGDNERAIAGDWMISRPKIERAGGFVAASSYRKTTIKRLRK